MVKIALKTFIVSLIISSAVCIGYLMISWYNMYQTLITVSEKKETIVEIIPEQNNHSYTPKLINEHSI